MDRSQTVSTNLMGGCITSFQSSRLISWTDTTCLDTHNRLVADVLTRYRTLMMLATIQAEGERSNANPETIAVTGISMKMEFDALVSRS